MKPSQDSWELNSFLGFVDGADSLLEIGSRYGETLKKMANVMQSGANIMSVDLPGAKWGRSNSEDRLKSTINELNLAGYHANLVLGDSHDDDVFNMVNDLAPYDIVFIDGDHSYDGVKSDFKRYGPMAKRIIALHDVASQWDCKRFWNDLNKTDFDVFEIVNIHSLRPPMGIGVLVRK